MTGVQTCALPIYEHQVEHFVNTTVAMERVTGNYLEGEQGICDNWAQYINSRDLTLEEAAAYVRATHAQASTSAHLIDAETLEGWSTRPRVNTADDYAVSYKRIELIGDGEWIADLGTAINISRTYTNPVNGEQSWLSATGLWCGARKQEKRRRLTCCASFPLPTCLKNGFFLRKNM